MNPSRRASAVLAAVFVFSALGCASTSRHQSTGEYADDAVITSRVKAAILKEPALREADIDVATFKGVVTLSGLVGTRGEMTRAVDRTHAIGGVKSVRNDMRLR